MSKAAVSLRAFSVYTFLLGLMLILDPNLLFRFLGIAQTREIWIRIVGLLVLILGYYDLMAARAEAVEFFRWSVHVRLFAAIVLIVFVATNMAPTVLILFALVDAGAAIWTALSLRRDVTQARLRR
jgi:hypothetical protein